MDELLQHCMRELAFDGDLGCDVSRLRHFIEEFYTSQAPTGNQTIDDAFHAFVWSFLIQQPSVRVGLVPHGDTIEVYVAPQLSKRKKVSKPKKKQLVPEPASFPALDEQSPAADDDSLDSAPTRLQPIDRAATYSLDQLIQQFGRGLRVAVDPETSFTALTGTHTRPAKLSPMVYTALQLISRGREAGLSVINLGKKTGYDQKTCFYLIKQLLELDLVVKLAQGGSGGGNFCIHKYFFIRSTFWKGVRREEVENDEGGNEEKQDESNDNDISSDPRRKLQFDPIDSRHLASPQLIKSRLIRLLKNSENGLHLYQNLLVTIGFAKPTRRDRRFFIVRIRELIKEGVIEKVIVPKMQGSLKTLCIRLVEENRDSDADGIVVQPGDVGDDEQELETVDDRSTDVPVINMTIHRQIVELLEEAGSEGLTLYNISSRLGMFDKRTIELLLYRLERYPPPVQLGDLAICDFIENQGRERRHRYYTLSGYLSFIEKEKIDHAERTVQYTSRDFSQSGGFYPQDDDLFYKDHAALVKYEDEYRDRIKPPKGGGTRKIGRPRKESSKPRKKTAVPDDAEADPPPEPRGKGKKAANANVENADGAQPATDKPTQKGTKRKRKADGEDGDNPQLAPKKKRPRPANKPLQQDENAMDIAVEPGPPLPTSEPKKQRGRPSKKPAVLSTENFDSQVIIPDSIEVGTTTAAEGVTGETSAQVSTPTVIPKNGQGVHTMPTVASQANPLHSGLQETAFTAPPSETVSGSPLPGLSTIPPAGSPADLGNRMTSHGGVQPSATISTPDLPTSQQPSNGALDASDTFISSKRERDPTNIRVFEVEEPPAKRPKSGRPKRSQPLINISQLRAENEIIRVVEESGGIVVVSSKEFFDTYTRVLSTMTEAGEATSMPVGAQPDRRTLRKILERLVDRGRLKTLTATVTSRVSQPRSVKLLYEPEVTQGRLDQYLSTLRDDMPVPNIPVHKHLDQPTDYTRPEPRRARDLLVTEDGTQDGGNKSESLRRVFNVFGSTDDDIHSAILSEHQTVAQLYGFLIGRARRARELHQFTLAHLQDAHLSSHIVSRTERIIAFPYYFSDLPVSTYFAIISATEYNAELSKLMETSEGRQTLVKDLPPDLHDKLKIGRARARDKLLGLLEILASLKLVTALQPSTTGTPSLTCDPNGTHPTQFDFIPVSRGRRTAGVSLSYWHFSTIAPIYFYSLTNPWPPPFHRDMFVRTADESMPFWFELEGTCVNKDLVDSATSMDSITGPCVCTPEMARGLRRRQSWISSYVLSWNQNQYLQQWSNPTTCYTPLSDPDGGRDCLERVCNVISAPFDIVHDFFATAHQLFITASERTHESGQRRREEKHERQANEVRALLAKKAAEARRQLALDWDGLVLRVHPAPLPYGSGTRLKTLRGQYMQSRAGMTNEQWKAAIMNTISGSKSGRRNPILPPSSFSQRSTFRPGTSTLPPIVPIQQKSVTELIERHKDKVPAVQALPPKKKKKKGTTPGIPDVDLTTTTDHPRRQRFSWTAEYDDLARDASVIIRARCRTWHRMDWAALEQVFPFLPRNSVRQRLVTLGQEAGGKSYLRLLEEKWHDLWLDHRGTEALPDDNPSDPADFDAVAHIEFLRKYIDKRALRVGFSKAPIQQAAGAILTETISDFASRWCIEEKARAFNKLDFMWTSIGDEHREKALLGEAFSTMQSSGRSPSSVDPLSNGVAESALKMTLTTAEEDYDPKNGAALLKSVGRETVRQASDELLARGVVSEVGKGHRKRPGRKLKISVLNEDALGGSFHPDFFSEACAAEDIFENETSDWREWSPIATDGEMAAFVELVSEGKLEFQIDISGSAAQRQQLDWNSKKVDDDQIATVVTMRSRPSPEHLVEPSLDSPDPVPIVMDIDHPDSVEHGQNCGEPAPCRLSSQGIITCLACITAEQVKFLAELDQESRRLCSDVLSRLDEAGNKGLNYETLIASSPQAHDIRAVVQRMTSGTEPLCYWVGYTCAVLVGRRHIGVWSISIPGPTLHLIFPRRWLNIIGKKMENVWNAGLRAVVGVLIVRPGIPQTEVRQRLLSVYDRQELNDLLSNLVEDDFVVRSAAPDHQDLASRDFRSIDGVEERQVYWTLKTEAWYRVND